MTFADWYNANIVPQLEENLKLYPVTAREAVRTASRLAMAACWNAALDSANVQIDRTSRQATEPQNPPITDLSLWVTYYRTLTRKSMELIRA